MKLLVDPMPELRARAAFAITERINTEAMATLHADMLALSRGDASAIAAREQRRLGLLQRIAEATSPADLDNLGE